MYLVHNRPPHTYSANGFDRAGERRADAAWLAAARAGAQTLLVPLSGLRVKLVEEKMIPIIRAHAISGHARFNSEHELLSEGKDGEALKMLIDVFSEFSSGR